jgi:hypothetical protein
MLRIALVTAVLFAALPARASKVEMCVDESCSAKVKREKLDCKIHRDKSLALGFKFSVAFLFSVGPEVSKRSDMKWDAMQKNLIRQYEELCDMHNKGLMSVAEFNKRYDKVNAYFDQAKDLKKELVAYRDAYDVVRDTSKKEFDDLDAETRKHSGMPPKEKVAKTLEKVDQLSDDVKELDEQSAKKSSDQ